MKRANLKKNKRMQSISISITKNILVGIMLGLFLSFGYTKFYSMDMWPGFKMPTQAISICFTPPSGCGLLIAREIRNAQDSIYLQAYGLTSEVIINQLMEASKKGIKVRAILDRSNFTKKKYVVDDLRKIGIEVVQDSISGIAHNKVMIIDGETVIAGSFNFTNAADKRNAENVLLIRDKQIADAYLANWKSRYEVSIQP